MSRSDRPIRVLHVVGIMNRGGVETWLMHVFRKIDRTRFNFDFLVHTDREGAFDQEIVALGGRILQCPFTHNPLRYARSFRKIVRDYGPFDVVHSHVHHFSGFVARLAHQARVPATIVQCHNDSSVVESDPNILRRLYLSTAERWVWKYGTVKLGVSAKSAATLFGDDAVPSGRCEVLHYGIELRPFMAPPVKSNVREEFGIPSDALVLGHVGNLHRAKNHELLLRIAVHLQRLVPCLRLLLVGAGPLRQTLQQKADQLGCAQNVIFAGVRDDVPRLLMGAVDVFVFPSLWEGLPIAVIEAQAAGVPVVLSTAVSREVEINPPLVTWRDPEEDPRTWAAAVLEAAGRRRIDHAAAVEAVEQASFSIDANVRRLADIYAARA